MDYNKKLGLKISNARKELGLTMKDLGDLLVSNPISINHYTYK